MKEAWSLKSRSRQCAGTETPFTDGQKIHAAIFPDPESSGYLRKDFTLEAWDQREDDQAPFSHWVTTYVAPVAEEKVEVVEEDPESLLQRLVEEDEAHTEKARYILAVMLERKKLLRETDTQPLPTGLLRVYEHRKTGDVFIIKDPQIPLAEVEHVQEEVMALLDPREIPSEEAPSDQIDPADQSTTATDEEE